MRLKRPYVARLDQVRITREPDGALIEYVEPGYGSTSFKLGEIVQGMTDQEVLDAFNDTIEAMQRERAHYHHVAVEIPPGKAQLEYYGRGGYWVARGDVLRCEISDGGPDNEPIIYIDDHELSWDEFGEALGSFAGWGMRLIIVPDDELDQTPRIAIREPPLRGRRKGKRDAP